MTKSILLFLLIVLLQAGYAFPLGGGKPTPKHSDEVEAAADDDEESSAVKSKIRGAALKLSSSTSTTINSKVSSSSSKTITSKALSWIVQTFFDDDTKGSSTSSSKSSTSITLRDAIRNVTNSTDMMNFMQTIRRSLHRHPELMYDLPFTSSLIQTALAELDIPYTTGWAKNTHQDVYDGPGGYGIVAHIGSMDPNQPCVILRADIDALPILEATKFIDDFKSAQRGKMHACGHDAHGTMLLGAAAVLKQIEPTISQVGTIRLVFQPAEEGGAGMKRMVEEGVVDLPPKALYGFGMHVWPAFPTGVIASRPGPLLAAAEMFEIVIHGKGGHAAMPHYVIDPVVASSAFVMNVQTLISRTISPLESGVISVTQIHAGDAFNVIPADVTLKGTIRSLSTQGLLSLRSKVEEMLHATAAVYGCNATIGYSPDYYPPTVNDPRLFEWSSQVGALVSREGTLSDTVPTMGGEDFSFLADAIPSTFFCIGSGSGGDERHHMPRTDFGLHHPSFALDESVMPLGAELHANLAIRALKELTDDSKATIKAEL